jgi:hypothetical protein
MRGVLLTAGGAAVNIGRCGGKTGFCVYAPASQAGSEHDAGRAAWGDATLPGWAQWRAHVSTASSMLDASHPSSDGVPQHFPSEREAGAAISAGTGLANPAQTCSKNMIASGDIEKKGTADRRLDVLGNMGRMVAAAGIGCKPPASQMPCS